MPFLDINELDPGHPDEKGDCGMVALKVALGIPYTTALRAATRLDAQQGRNGLWLRTIQRIAHEHGTTLVQRRRFDWDDTYGIIAAPNHVAVLRNGLVLDRMQSMEWDVWLVRHRCKAADCVVLVEKKKK
jgi:hypothetical protein